jgi:hypothetical protein
VASFFPQELLNNPKRILVRQGLLHLWSDVDKKMKPRYFFLFNDVLLITKKSGSKFILRVYITFKASLRVTTEGVGVEFRIIAPERVFVIRAEDEQDRAEWVKDIRRGLDEATGRGGRDNRDRDRDRDRGGARDDLEDDFGGQRQERQRQRQRQQGQRWRWGWR